MQEVLDEKIVDSRNNSGSDSDGIESYEEMNILEKLRKSIKNIRASPQKRENFKKHCEFNDIKCLELIRH
ncbi:hypothetical protein A3Q56_06313 [Intoshia linei]|uniref:Uncharacterized protein n=1 Tax=Intoshia linei TaxID=1819745 RepID=A0A177AVC2_9BILA|nr:hypothetical protein A3Q56_06313 [Intoshia linei]